MPNEVDVNAMSDEEFVDFIKGLEDEEDEDDLSNSSEAKRTDVYGEQAERINALPTRGGRTEEYGEQAERKITLPTNADGQSGDGEVGTGKNDGANERLLSHIKGLYPDMEEGAAIDKFLDEADESEAAAQGLSLEDYRKNKAEQAEFAEFKAEKEKKQQNDEAVSSIVESWKADSERMKSIIPDFDFAKAMENGQFRDKVIKEGKDVITAYFELNPINQPPVRKDRRDIEVGDMTGGASGGFKSPMDVRRASDEEFDRYLAQIKDRDEE